MRRRTEGLPHLVFLPGHMCDSRLFEPQIKALSSRCSSIRVGTLGDGETIRNLARSVLERAPRLFALAGLSLGGIVALEVMRQAPHRVTHLALMDANARPESARRRRARTADMAAVRRGRLAEVTRAAKSAYLGSGMINRSAMRSLLSRMSLELGEEVYLRQARALKSRPDSRSSLSLIRCPTLILGGREDRLCPPRVQMEMAACIPQADVVLLGGCGHLSTLEQPAEVTAELARLLLKSPVEVAH